jgi:hypothetical protein
MIDKPSYYAVIIAEVRYDKRLKANAKLLYAEITSLCNKEGFCWASNKYFAEIYEVHEMTISKWISQLNKLGYIEVEIINYYSRKIYLKGLGGGKQNGLGGSAKTLRGVKPNDLHNTKDNSKINNSYKKTFKKGEIITPYEGALYYPTLKEIVRSKMAKN